MAEPILWADKASRQRKILAKKYNRQTGEMEQVYDEDTGEPLYEKIPQRGHPGDPLSYMNPGLQPLQFRRWLHVLKHDGNEVRVPLTNGAAHDNPGTSFGQYMTAKARHFGWIPVGVCPLYLVDTGQIKRGQLASQAVKKAKKACEHGTYGANKPCPHYLDELDARQERRRKVQEGRDRKFQPEAEKALEEQRKATKDIASAVADAVAGAMKGEK